MLIPALPHIIITTPFVIRIMLPAIRSLEPEYYEQAQMLGLSPTGLGGTAEFRHLGPNSRICSHTMAFSLGEFGASWILAVWFLG